VSLFSLIPILTFSIYLDNLFIIQLDSFAGDIELLSSNFRKLTLEVYGANDSILRNLIQSLSKLVDTFRSVFVYVQENKDLFKVLGSVILETAKILLIWFAGAKLTPIWFAMKKGLTDIAFMWNYNKLLIAEPIR
jgi:hypothetical protein